MEEVGRQMIDIKGDLIIGGGFVYPSGTGSSVGINASLVGWLLVPIFFT
jgi:hypothetical protein